MERFFMIWRMDELVSAIVQPFALYFRRHFDAKPSLGP